MDAPQSSSSPFVSSRIIRVIAVTFIALWLFHVLYDDPTRGTISLAVSRIYLSVGGLFIVLAVAFNAVASCVKILEQRLKRLEQTHVQSHNQGDAS